MMEYDDEKKCSNFCFTAKAKTVINERDIDEILESIYSTIISKHTKIS